MLVSKQAENFRLLVQSALLRRPRGQRSISWLARRIGKRRETVSRAVNRGEFPQVQEQIARQLQIPSPAAP